MLKKMLFIAAVAVSMVACGNNETDTAATTETNTTAATKRPPHRPMPVALAKKMPTKA